MDTTGVIILYADDQTYDIERLRDFVEQGKKRLAESVDLSAARVSIQFGGYRDYPQVDYWIVPARGKAPVPTPHERTVEDSGETEN